MAKWWFFLFCVFTKVHSKGLIIIPGLGRSDRVNVVIHNLQLLEQYIRPQRWDCTVYVYAPRTDTSFWSLDNELQYIRSLCTIIENPKKLVTENLYMSQPALIKHIYSRIFILLDDCKLQAFNNSNTFDLNFILRVMKYNNLTVVSPKISGAFKGGGQKFRLVMQMNPPNIDNAVGYVSTFIELFAWIMTFSAYESLWELLAPSINPYGWGYDFWYHGYCQMKHPQRHKMGVLSVMEAVHMQSSGDRTDNTSGSLKWKAVKQQEEYYQKYLGIPLKKYAQHLDLRDMTETGAIKGYIYLPNERGRKESLS